LYLEALASNLFWKPELPNTKNFSNNLVHTKVALFFSEGKGKRKWLIQKV